MKRWREGEREGKRKNGRRRRRDGWMDEGRESIR